MRLEGCQSMADLTLSPAISACSPNVFQCSALCVPRASVSCLSSSPAAHPLPATRRRLQKRGERIAAEISAVKIRYSPLELKKLSGKRSRSVGGVHAVWKQARDPTSASEQSQESKPAGLELIQGEEQFDRALAEAQERSKPIVIDWMAAWCRKCIYLKPKLEKLADEFRPDIKFYCVDVNNVPQALVKRAEVTKMPTIQLWKNGEKQDEVIGGHKAWLVVEEVREMLQKHLRQ